MFDKRNYMLVAVAALAAAAGGQGQMTAEAKTTVVPKYGVFEVAIASKEKFANPFADARARATFTSPSGKQIHVDGFYYGGDEWRVRFVPRERGQWSYAARLTTEAGHIYKRGAFQCKGRSGRGFVKLSKRNPYRMEYDDGTPFYPIGIQTCDFLQPDFDGPNPDGSWRSTTTQQWCEAFAGAVNLVRTQFGCGSTVGCALPLIAKGGPADRYDTELAARIDKVYRLHRAAGISQIIILFQDMSLWGHGRTAFGKIRDLREYKSLQAKNRPLQEQYIRYVVARYGCFVDIWELFNEDSYAPDDYLAHLAQTIRQADPYDHIITTNYARPAQPWCEIITWHEYMAMGPGEVDAYITKVLAGLKSYGKVVQNTEFGNQGWLSNYDPVKWRIAVWTAFMNESGVLFWGMSGRKVPAGRTDPRGNSNAYIGPQARKYFRVLNDFTAGLPIDMRPVRSGYTEHTDIRTYALSNGKTTVLYVHHFADHTKPFQWREKLFVVTGAGKFNVRWINPADGKEIRTDQLSTEQTQLAVPLPPVTIDAACRIDRVD